jgi:protease-4
VVFVSFRNPLLLLLSAIALGVVLLALATANFSQFGKGLFLSKGADCVGVIRLDGEISDSGGQFFSSQSLSDRFAAALGEANSDSSIGSVLLVINSPGGSAVASKEIYDEVAASKKPVVAYLGEVAASGGYYVASGTDYIVANPNTITGSIGARATLLNYAELFTKLGLRTDTIKSGELKDIGDGSRNLTGAERLVIQSLINESFDNFRADVEAGRNGKLNKKLFASVLDARLLTAKQALSAGLIDGIGSRRTALEKAASLGNVTVEKGESPQECELEEQTGLSAILGGLSSGFAAQIAQGLSEPRLSLRYQ